MLCIWVFLLAHLSSELKALSPASIDSLRAVIAENKGDTNQVKAFYDYGFLLFYKDMPEARSSFSKGLSLAEGLDWTYGTLLGRYYIGEVLRAESKFDSCLAFAKETAIRAKQAGNKKYLVSALLQIAGSKEQLGDWKGGIEALHYAREEIKPDSNIYRNRLARVEYTLSIQYFIVMDHKAAMFHLKEARRHFQEDGDLEGLGLVENELGNHFQVTKDFDKARQHYLNAIQIAEKVNVTSISLGQRYQNLGVCYSKMGLLDSTIFYFKKAKAILDRGPEGAALAGLITNIAGMYNETGKPKLGLLEGRRAYSLARKFKLKHLECRAGRNLAMSFVLDGQPDSANHYFLLSDSLRIDLYDTSRIQEIAQVRIGYEAELKQAEIDLLDAKAESLALSNERQNYWLGLLGLGLVVVILLAALFLLRGSNRRRLLQLELAKQDAEFRHRRADLEQRALRAQMNPHFIFNCLNAIQRLYVVGDLNKAGEYMSDFAQLLRKILTHSSKPNISIAEEVETLQLYLRLEQARLDNSYDFEIEINEDIDIYHTYMPPLLIQPFAENAIWHGLAPNSDRKGMLKISLDALEDRPEFDRLVCVIQDNGIGIEVSKSEKGSNSGHESKGMSLTRERLGPEGSLQAIQAKEGGTIIRIVVPVSANPVTQ